MNMDKTQKRAQRFPIVTPRKTADGEARFLCVILPHAGGLLTFPLGSIYSRHINALYTPSKSVSRRHRIPRTAGKGETEIGLTLIGSYDRKNISFGITFD